MAGVIDRAKVAELVAHGTPLIEVLPANEYAEDHLPGAISIPLRQINAEAVASLDRAAGVVVYCWDAA